MNKEKEKNASRLTEKEILRQQLELLAERSKYCMDEELNQITSAMVSIYIALETMF